MKVNFNTPLAILVLLTITHGSFALKSISNINYLDRVDEPVIGIVTLPTSSYFKKKFGRKYKAMIPTSYKKWIELTGARAVAVPHFASISEIKKIMAQINGLLLPGGKTELMR